MYIYSFSPFWWEDEVTSRTKVIKPFLFPLTTFKENLLSTETDSEWDGKFTKRANVQFTLLNKTFIIYPFLLYFLSLSSISVNRVLYQTVSFIIKFIEPAKSRQLHTCCYYRWLSILQKGNAISLHFAVSSTWITSLRSEIRFYFKVGSVELYYRHFPRTCVISTKRDRRERTCQKTFY